jgi:hypothetical protein
VWVCRTQYIWDPSDSKLLFAELLCDMSVMEGGAPGNVAGGASVHADETAQKPLAHLGFKQAVHQSSAWKSITRNRTGRGSDTGQLWDEGRDEEPDRYRWWRLPSSPPWPSRPPAAARSPPATVGPIGGPEPAPAHVARQPHGGNPPPAGFRRGTTGADDCSRVGGGTAMRGDGLGAPRIAEPSARMLSRRGSRQGSLKPPSRLPPGAPASARL